MDVSGILNKIEPYLYVKPLDFKHSLTVINFSQMNSEYQ